MNESVSYFAFEREKTRLERTNRRIYIFALILLALVLASNFLWALRFIGHEKAETQKNVDVHQIYRYESAEYDRLHRKLRQEGRLNGNDQG